MGCTRVTAGKATAYDTIILYRSGSTPGSMLMHLERQWRMAWMACAMRPLPTHMGDTNETPASVLSVVVI